MPLRKRVIRQRPKKVTPPPSRRIRRKGSVLGGAPPVSGRPVSRIHPTKPAIRKVKGGGAPPSRPAPPRGGPTPKKERVVRQPRPRARPIKGTPTLIPPKRPTGRIKPVRKPKKRVVQPRGRIRVGKQARRGMRGVG